MKLLLDTNVQVAALVARGTCSDLLEHCVRQHVVVSSQSLLKELREVLERKFGQRAIDVRAALQLFAETFTLVTPVTLDPPACRDRDDDIVFATTLAGECAATISGAELAAIISDLHPIPRLRHASGRR